MAKQQTDFPAKSIEDMLAEANAPTEVVDQSALDVMSHDEMKSLVRRLLCQCGMVATMTEEEIRQAFLDRMAHIGLTGKAQEALMAMERRMDRVEGKPMQRQQSLVAVADANKPLPDNDRMALEHYFKIRGLSVTN